MGVEFFSCHYCGSSVCDAGRYTSCGENCSNRWCNTTCAKEEGRYDDEDLISCNFCREEDVEDYQLLKFLMSKYKLTREKLVKMYKESK